ncbi:hypothetical protein EV426DRAFT_594965 [Tirmania nivea]|nr:hypothetical protein EV426DRAFT_594965 [Tirmania nivea]
MAALNLEASPPDLLEDSAVSSTATISVSPKTIPLLSRSTIKRRRRQLSPSDSPHRILAGSQLLCPASAPLPVLPSLYTSTPCKRKAVSIPLSLQSAESEDGNEHSSAKRHHRRAKDVRPLIASELRQAAHRSDTFPEDFLLRDSWGVQVPDAEFILCAILRDLPPAHGVRHHPTTGQHTCNPPNYSNTNYPEWFCRFANAIRGVNNSTPPLCQSVWVSTKNASPTGILNGDLRPDFILTTKPDAPTWSSVLVVGEHQSKGSDPFNQLATYAEQVFIAQPFRVAVLGILTSNSGPRMTFWRFDRAGALGSVELDYLSTARQLSTVVRCLYAIPRMPARAIGFHVDSIIDTDLPANNPFPLDYNFPWRMQMTQPIPGRDAADMPSMQGLLFVAPGLVTRGTRVWRGEVGQKQVVIKYSWRSAQRIPEADLYHLASARRVIGIADLLAYDTYEDILSDVRLGCRSSSKELEEYNLHMASHNRKLTRLILAPAGRAISNRHLTPTQVARALLAGLIGHGSLFFDAGILHRDLSPQNVIYTEAPRRVNHQWLCGSETNLYGCLIDLDYAIDTQSAGAHASNAADRTGTYPFIAIKVLSRREPHRYRHDLESLLYVLLWVSCYPVRAPGPATLPAVPHVTQDLENEIWPREAPLKTWISGDEQTVTAHKTTNVVTDQSRFEQLLDRFREGFGPFRDAARKLRRTLWGLHGLDFCLIVPEGVPGAEENNLQRSWLLPEEVRIGVSNRVAYGEAKRALQELVDKLEAEPHESGVA